MDQINLEIHGISPGLTSCDSYVHLLFNGRLTGPGGGRKKPNGVMIGIAFFLFHP